MLHCHPAATMHVLSMVLLVHPQNILHLSMLCCHVADTNRVCTLISSNVPNHQQSCLASPTASGFQTSLCLGLAAGPRLQCKAASRLQRIYKHSTACVHTPSPHNTCLMGIKQQPLMLHIMCDAWLKALNLCRPEAGCIISAV